MIKRTEDRDMQNDIAVRNNVFTFNWPTIISVGTAAVIVITYMNKLDARIGSVEEYRVTRSAVTDRKFEDIQQSLIPLANLPYRVNILEQQQTAFNLRLDRFMETLTASIELIRKDVNVLGTKVEVLSEKIDGLVPQKRAELDNLPPSLR